jgi:hypothetical protein
VHLAVLAEALDPRPVAAHRVLAQPPVLAQQAELPRDHAAAAVGGDHQPRLDRSLAGPVRRHDATHAAVAPDERAGPRAFADLGPRAAGGGEQAGVEIAPARREPRLRGAAVGPLEARPVGRGQLHPAQRMGAQRAHVAVRPHRRQQPPGLGGDALAADLVPREARLVEQQHVVAALAQEDRGRGARGAAPHHHDVARAGAHQPDGRSATATSR